MYKIGSVLQVLFLELEERLSPAYSPGEQPSGQLRMTESCMSGVSKQYTRSFKRSYVHLSICTFLSGAFTTVLRKGMQTYAEMELAL